jgi:AcrR family transcriptional regulator
MAQAQRINARKQPRQRRAQETVEAILQATAHLLVTQGYEHLTTNRVADHAGVSIGSLYQYFPSKEALVAALVDDHTDHMLQLLAQNVEDLRGASLEDAVRTYVHAQLHAHAMEPELHRVLCEQLPRLHGFERVRELNVQAASMVQAFFELHANRIRVKDLHLAAYICVHAVEATTHAAILDGPERLNDKALAEELCHLVLRYLLDDYPPGRGTRVQ